jgi:transaldolase/glucose-6-phosphate isomerase
MGLDVPDLLRRAALMVNACAADVPPASNPGVELGAILGCLGRHGRDKVTFALDPDVASLGSWLEQLLAESTGKHGKGLIPIDGETLVPASEYGQDRLFVRIALADPRNAKLDEGFAAIRAAGHPTVAIELGDRRDLVQEFFRWEIATAVAGAILEINPFDQPDVEASKVATRRLTEQYKRTGSLPQTPALVTDGSLSLFTDHENRRALAEAAGAEASLAAMVRAHLGRLRAGDYFAALAYIPMTSGNQQILDRIRTSVRAQTGAATAVEFGPRFLHSTGQAYKGGPPTGLFIQITSDDPADAAIPGEQFTFGVVKAAQAAGDLSVLFERGRRAVRIHIRGSVEAGLNRLARIVDEGGA